MKKIFTIAMIAACAMMVFSCKNNGQEEENALENAASDAVESVEGAARKAGKASRKAAKDVKDATKDAIDRTDEALEKLDDIIPAAAAEVQPTFNGGDANAFVKYIQDNLVYPQVAIDNGEQGRVVVSFIVDASGKVKNARVSSSVSNSLDAEALRVVEGAPDWTPAKVGGKNVPVAYSVPVVFSLR
ncbi:MAG: energy transducer TonB [Bacteroidales bacterium]|nr:energy transducer TonB [Bacteroidales bacterium]